MESIAPPPTRELRGLALYRDHAGEIEPLGKGRYTVPGCSGGSYTVDLKVFTDEPETCTCPDHSRHPELSCKHICAATIFRAKSRSKAHKETGRPVGGAGDTNKPHASGGGSVRAIMTGVLFSIPAYFLLFVVTG